MTSAGSSAADRKEFSYKVDHRDNLSSPFPYHSQEGLTFQPRTALPRKMLPHATTICWSDLQERGPELHMAAHPWQATPFSPDLQCLSYRYDIHSVITDVPINSTMHERHNIVKIENLTVFNRRFGSIRVG